MSTIYVIHIGIMQAYDIAETLEGYAEYTVPGTSTTIVYPIAQNIVKIDTPADFKKHFKSRGNNSIDTQVRKIVIDIIEEQLNSLYSEILKLVSRRKEE